MVKRKRWEDLYQEDRLKKERLTRQSSEYESLRKSIQMQHCTFHPKISKSPMESQGGRDTSKSNDEKLRNINTIFERQLIWKKERDLSKLLVRFDILYLGIEKMQNDKVN